MNTLFIFIFTFSLLNIGFSCENEKKFIPMLGAILIIFVILLCLGITILLSLTVFLNMVAETMPATSEAVPLLGKLSIA